MKNVASWNNLALMLRNKNASSVFCHPILCRKRSCCFWWWCLELSFLGSFLVQKSTLLCCYDSKLEFEARQAYRSAQYIVAAPSATAAASGTTIRAEERWLWGHPQDWSLPFSTLCWPTRTLSSSPKKKKWIPIKGSSIKGSITYSEDCQWCGIFYPCCCDCMSRFFWNFQSG